jgi:hypothetical protein
LKADLILLKRRRSPALTEIETHQASVDGLVVWIQDQQPPRNLDRGFPRLCFRVMRQQLLERSDCELLQPLPLGA